MKRSFPIKQFNGGRLAAGIAIAYGLAGGSAGTDGTLDSLAGLGKDSPGARAPITASIGCPALRCASSAPRA